MHRHKCCRLVTLGNHLNTHTGKVEGKNDHIVIALRYLLFARLFYCLRVSVSIFNIVNLLKRGKWWGPLKLNLFVFCWVKLGYSHTVYCRAGESNCRALTYDCYGHSRFFFPVVILTACVRGLISVQFM